MKLGFIGVGNMGQAILEGILSTRMMPPDQIVIYDLNQQKTAELQSRLHVHVATSCNDAIMDSDIILLAVKPNVCGQVLTDTATYFDKKAIISIVTGWDRAKIAQYLPKTCRILRVMPNTPCMVGCGMTVLDLDHSLASEEFDFAKQIFSSIGIVEAIPSYLMDAVTGVSGSGPAYGYVFIEALADGGVRAGLPRDVAYRLAAQTLLGAAKMVLDTHQHPGQLKDAVCSPAGTTIEAVYALEHGGLRASVMDAVEVCVAKAKAMKNA